MNIHDELEELEAALEELIQIKGWINSKALAEVEVIALEAIDSAVEAVEAVIKNNAVRNNNILEEETTEEEETAIITLRQIHKTLWSIKKLDDVGIIKPSKARKIIKEIEGVAAVKEACLLMSERAKRIYLKSKKRKISTIK